MLFAKLNPIERVWAQLKRYTKAHCKYSLPSLRKNIPLAYDTVTLENIQNHFRKIRHYMFCYLEGLSAGKELDNALKKYKKAVKSHRKMSEHLGLLPPRHHNLFLNILPPSESC